EPVINGYGDRVLYTTTASNLLVETDTNSVSDIILYHIDSGLSERINRTEEGEEMTTVARHPSLSGDGSVAVYEVGDKEAYRQIYLARLDSSGTSILSPVSSHDEEGNPLDNHHPAISPDGRYIAYVEESASSEYSLILLDLQEESVVRWPCPVDIADAQLLRPLFYPAEQRVEWTVIDEGGVAHTFGQNIERAD
ncbi:MAG: hypothetical protein MI754_10255, partial [Chromatiales bacterium]|nr:hypothetical protein [Chromatiales bacterium]